MSHIDEFRHTEERRAQAEDLLHQGEQFVINSNWIEAKDCFIDACDYFMELVWWSSRQLY
jgi:hypothetical protein